MADSARRPAALPATPLIQLALGWWERHLKGDQVALGRFVELCTAIEARAERHGDGLRWPTRTAVAKHQLAPPWYSALSQGQAASVFVRAHLATGDDRYAETAVSAVEPLLASAGCDIVTVTGAGPILEEAPSVPGSHVLNGWISALMGVRDVEIALTHGPSAAVFSASLACLAENLPAYDTGWWTRYSLYPHALEDLAKPIYHRVHIDQAEVLYRISGRPEFMRARDRWRSYDRAVNRLAAVTQKGVFAVLDARRRRRWSQNGD